MKPTLETAWSNMAIMIAQESHCLSQRGVVIFDQNGAISVGVNHQPEPFSCDQSARCKSTCGKIAVHAEQAAIIAAGRRTPTDFNAGDRLPGSSLVHVKVSEGKPVASGPPSCLECSKLILEVGIAYVWLLHAEGWRRYNAQEFHAASARYHVISLSYQGVLV